jgi:methyl-accepting chemotaxis protein
MMKRIREKLELKIMGFVLVFLVIGSMWVVSLSYFERKDLLTTAEDNLDTTASILAVNINRAMLERFDRKSKIMWAIVDDLKTVKGIENITILNPKGREAFKKDSPATESSVLQTLSAKHASFSYVSGKSLIFYKPLENGPSCKGCHPTEGAILGAVKVSMSLEKVYGKSMTFLLWTTIVSVCGIIGFTFVFWRVLRRLVIRPIHSVEKAAEALEQGDLSFNIDVKSKDEMGRLSDAINLSLHSLSNVLQRALNGSKRAAIAAEKAESESKKMSEGTKLESEAITNISSSIEEMNAVVVEISEGTNALAASAEETAASMEEMVTSIGQVTNDAQELSSEVDSTSALIEEMSAATKQVADSTKDLSAESEETLSAVEEIASSINEVEQNAKESAKLSEKVKNDAATFGISSIEKTLGGMQNIRSSVEKTANFINKLGGRSDEIGKILNVIDEITDQTTLLALNAAILAAQAGEHGRGFSVVADEIKSLAERTSFSTQEIASLIQSVQQEMKDAVHAMDEGLRSVEDGFKVTKEAGDALNKIVESAARSSEMAFSIERSTTEQVKGTKLVAKAMERVKDMVEHIAKATSEQNKSALLLTKATEKMRDVASHVKTATGEQQVNTKQISGAIELVSDKSQQIARAINEQKSGLTQILSSIEKIKDIPKQNMNVAFDITRSLRGLLKNTELVNSEMERFKIFEDKDKLLADAIRFGVEPVGSPVEAFKNFTPLTEYLMKKLGKKVELRVVSDYEGALRDISKGITHACFMMPTSYVEAHKKYGVEVIAKALTGGKAYHHSVIIARSDSKINSVQDIRGHTFAFGDPHSVSSYVAPRVMLLDAGIDLKDLHYYEYLGPQDAVADAVLNGTFDAGGVTESAALKFKDKGLKFIKLSGDLPGFCICVSRTLPEKDRSVLKTALTALTSATPEGSEILTAIYKRYSAFEEASDREYDNLRLMMSKLGMI